MTAAAAMAVQVLFIVPHQPVSFHCPGIKVLGICFLAAAAAGVVVAATAAAADAAAATTTTTTFTVRTGTVVSIRTAETFQSKAHT